MTENDIIRRMIAAEAGLHAGDLLAKSHNRRDVMLFVALFVIFGLSVLIGFHI
jgi:hypothetical protein